ncbi:DUF1015 family protein [Pedobacter jeongneungensis]|uniref:DUF1015 family protein n=1 Tax=Pedobacter jeongneungensis TaxID=947309 RepID=UPI0004683B80|nr:DUF1015 domain-containing protein [Pedobacter jeongneungensis]
MANISAFRALCPEQSWFTGLLRRAGEGNRELKYALEGRGDAGMGTGRIDRVEEELLLLVKNNKYLNQENEAIFIYEQESVLGRQRGVWALADVQDFIDGVIIPHEKTLADRENRLAEYRSCLGLEGSPVLLTYRNHQGISDFISKIIQGNDFTEYLQEGRIHRLWKVSSPQDLEEITMLFERAGNIYVGDGHHRLAAAGRLQRQSRQWIMALFVGTADLNISSFTRLISLDKAFDEGAFLTSISKLFFISAVPSNKRYLPDRLHRFGMCLKGQWYQLDLKSDLYAFSQMADVHILQEHVLCPMLGISSPQTDPSLVSDPLADLAETMEKITERTDFVLFTLFPMSICKLLEHSDKGQCFPPKSSYIEPKVPYGLLLNAQEIMNRNPKIDM